MRAKRVSETLQVERRSDGKRKLTRALSYEIDGKEVTVGVGFDTDYSSVPLGLRWFVHWIRIDTAGVVHDYLARMPGSSRWRDDLIWFKIARLGCPRALVWQAAGGWVAIRLFGWLSKTTGPNCSLVKKLKKYWMAAVLDVALIVAPLVKVFEFKRWLWHIVECLMCCACSWH